MLSGRNGTEWRVFEERVLSRIFGIKREKVARGCI
jgi:hypothetical protein